MRLEKGLYFKTFQVEKRNIVYYIGETNRLFETRFLEHLEFSLNGKYEILDLTEVKKGKRVPLWDGWYRMKKGREYVYEIFLEFNNRIAELGSTRQETNQRNRYLFSQSESFFISKRGQAIGIQNYN